MAEKVIKKLIDGPNWQWGEDYVWATASYVVACPPDRTCQVGMGVFVAGEPRGEKLRFSGTKEFLVMGVGALHFRVDDGLGPCEVNFCLKEYRPVKWSWEF